MSKCGPGEREVNAVAEISRASESLFSSRDNVRVAALYALISAGSTASPDIRTRARASIAEALRSASTSAALTADERRQFVFGIVDLSSGNVGSDLSGDNLSGLSLQGIPLDYADLTKADLRRADLTGSSLRGARLADVQMQQARLDGADLTGADIATLGAF